MTKSSKHTQFSVTNDRNKYQDTQQQNTYRNQRASREYLNDNRNRDTERIEYTKDDSFLDNVRKKLNKKLRESTARGVFSEREKNHLNRKDYNRDKNSKPTKDDLIVTKDVVYNKTPKIGITYVKVEFETTEEE